MHPSEQAFTSDAFLRAKRRLWRQVIFLGIMTSVAVVGKRYVVSHLEQTAKTLAAEEALQQAQPTVEVGGETAINP